MRGEHVGDGARARRRPSRPAEPARRGGSGAHRRSSRCPGTARPRCRGRAAGTAAACRGAASGASAAIRSGVSAPQPRQVEDDRSRAGPAGPDRSGTRAGTARRAARGSVCRRARPPPSGCGAEQHPRAAGRGRHAVFQVRHQPSLPIRSWRSSTGRPSTIARRDASCARRYSPTSGRCGARCRRRCSAGEPALVQVDGQRPPVRDGRGERDRGLQLFARPFRPPVIHARSGARRSIGQIRRATRRISARRPELLKLRQVSNVW